MIEHRNDSAGLPEAYGRCSCGWTVTRLFGARRAVDRHVEAETHLELLRVRTRAVEDEVPPSQAGERPI